MNKKITQIETTPQEFCDKFLRTLNARPSGLYRMYSVENSRMKNSIAGHTGSDIFLSLFEGSESCLGTVVVGTPSETLVNTLIPPDMAAPIIARCIEIEESNSQASAEAAYKKL